MKNKLLVVAGLAMAWLTAAPAMAGVGVELNIGVPGLYVQPAPVYVQPSRGYVESRSYYGQPQPYYVQPQPYYVEREYRREWRGDRGYRHGRDRHYIRRDRDGDGVPNRYDRRPNNPYRD